MFLCYNDFAPLSILMTADAPSPRTVRTPEPTLSCDRQWGHRVNRTDVLPAEAELIFCEGNGLSDKSISKEREYFILWNLSQLGLSQAHVCFRWCELSLAHLPPGHLQEVRGGRGVLKNHPGAEGIGFIATADVHDGSTSTLSDFKLPRW